MSQVIDMPTAHDTRRRYAGYQLMRLLGEWAPERDSRDLEDMTGRIVEMLGVYAAEVECRAQIAEATLRKYALNSVLLAHPMQPPTLHPAYADQVEAMARAILAVK